MQPKGDDMKDLTILLDNTPQGVLEILSELTRAHVDVQAGCLFSRTEGPVMHLAVEDDAASTAHEVLTKAGLPPSDEREVVVVSLREHQVVDVLGVMRRLAAAGVMPTTAYLGAGGRLVVGAADLDATRAALEGI
jgi:hypothetical protein